MFGKYKSSKKSHVKESQEITDEILYLLVVD